ncbi:J domain-containing protein [Lysobacter spongiae]|uniref:J domain-containing protein n=2 Tax=Marilutibacter spongiae TaxID=2025720 RepID=A0A7W3Y6F6_9GAMM|nr:J domain-containing protein [Lysobacter spongiae]
MDSDFNRLYAQLGLRPDCTLEAFKRAYRRKVAELHPDRHPGATTGAAEADALSLSELTSLYTTATRFHRAHGRLPGAAPSSRLVEVPRRRHVPPAEGDTTLPMRLEADGNPRRQTRLAALVVVLIVVLIVILEASTPEGRPATGPDRARAAPPTSTPAPSGGLPSP